MSDDHLDDLSRRLFSAGHAEQPSEALRERLLVRRPPSGEVPLPRRESPRAAGRAPRALAGWLLAAALFGGALFLFQRLSAPELVDATLISPERLPKATHPGRAEQQPAGSVSELGAGATKAGEQQAGEQPGKPAPAPTSERGEQEAPRLPRPPRVPPVTLATPSVAPRPPARAARPSLAQELELLKRARATLRSGDSGGALALLDAYANEVGGSDLQDEASVLYIEALAAAGRHVEAAALAERFTREKPNSPLVDRAQSFIKPSEAARDGETRPAP